MYVNWNALAVDNLHFKAYQCLFISVKVCKAICWIQSMEI